MVLKLGADRPTPPPPKPGRPANVRTLPTPPASKIAERQAAVDGIFQLAGFGCILTGQYADAGAIGKHGPPISLELAKIAEGNETVAKAIDWLNNTGPYAGLIIAALPLTLQILANHGTIKAEGLGAAGVVSPEALAAQAKAQVVKQQAEALAMQRAAEAELAQMQAEAAPNGRTPVGNTTQNVPVV